jgi:hypothetical protein
MKINNYNIKILLNNLGVRVVIGFLWLRIGRVAGCFVYVDEYPRSCNRRAI